MQFRGSALILACCMAFAIPAVVVSVKDSDYPKASRLASAEQNQSDNPSSGRQTQTSNSKGARQTQGGDTASFPARTVEPGPTHGHPSEANPGRNAHDSGHGEEIAGISAGVVGTVVILELIHHHEVVNKLKANGPQLPKAFDMNNLHLTAFVQDNWPVAVEYALPGSVEAKCGITVGQKKGLVSLPPTNGARHIVVTRIPAGYSKKPSPADYWLHLDASPIPVGPSGWPGLRLYAVAAGPRAVGSVAIDQVSFAPADKPVHQSAREVALFGFHSHGDFDSVTAEFQLVAPYQGHNFVSTEETMEVRPVSEGEQVQGLQWQPRKVRSGDHIVRIVAWRGIDRGADWVSAFSADMVSVEK